MHDILMASGFCRTVINLSKFDDWYVFTRLFPRVEAVFDL